jgi:16S rRNA (uracil1498-N3)-methyltransferase
MKETRFFYVPDAENATELPAEEASHAVKVLRLKGGDELMLMDGVGNFYRAEVTLAAPHHCLYRILEKMPQPRQWQGSVHLAIAPTKMNDRIEWLAEKATEVGLDELSFLNCQFSERRNLKTERISKIVVSAVKQSHKAFMPVVNELTPFKQFVAAHHEGHRYIAHCYQEVDRVNLFDELCRLNASEDALVMIGPEGDFSIDEVRLAVDAGFVSVDLGKSRLRTETAGLSAVMMMQLAKQISL